MQMLWNTRNCYQTVNCYYQMKLIIIFIVTLENYLYTQLQLLYNKWICDINYFILIMFKNLLIDENIEHNDTQYWII